RMFDGAPRAPDDRSKGRMEWRPSRRGIGSHLCPGHIGTTDLRDPTDAWSDRPDAGISVALLVLSAARAARRIGWCGRTGVRCGRPAVGKLNPIIPPTSVEPDRPA